MHQAEGQRAQARQNEREETEGQLAAVEMDLSLQDLLDDMLLRETQLTSLTLHQALQDQFIRSFNTGPAAATTTTGQAA